VQHLAELPENASETVRAAFEGKADVEVITGEKGDIVRAVARSSGVAGRQDCGVETLMSPEIRSNVEAIKAAYKNYQTLESWKTPIKVNYLLI